VDFALSTEQEDFRRTVRKFLADRSPLAKVRRVANADPGYDAQLWSTMSDQLGLAGLLVPLQYGGSEASAVDAAIVMEELGRSLAPSPFFATAVLGVSAILLAADDEQKNELLPLVASGKRTLTVAFADGGPAGAANGTAMHTSRSGAVTTLTGTRTQVIDGHHADTIIVVAADEDDPARLQLHLVDGTAAGLRRTRVETLDATRPMATLEFDGVCATPLGDPITPATLSQLIDIANTALAAEMVGGIEAAMTMAVDYAKLRVQFNRPIGSFQAIKHRCAEMAIELDTARAAALYAAFVAAESSQELPLVAPLAKATAAAAFDFAASWNIQIHGGIGFTWEHDAHLYYRRAAADKVLFGSVQDQWLQLADRIGL
jgi:alkylation response protein AidB-like acyl-CoA dehydrogenase